MLLSVRGLKTYFFMGNEVIKAVNEVDFDLGEGEILGIVGESGSGKSVCARSILRILPVPPAKISGEIYFKGEDLLKLNESQMQGIRGKEISMIFQEPMTSLNPVLTIGQQIAESIIFHQKLNKTEAWQKNHRDLRIGKNSRGFSKSKRISSSTERGNETKSHDCYGFIFQSLVFDCR
jgi:ABC-type dipeptide/oligopeptide/nickel transport system ATPase component